MRDSTHSDIETGVIQVLKSVSRRPIEPTPASDLVADLGFDNPGCRIEMARSLLWLAPKRRLPQ